jgi:nucleoside-diphosphate-sugar epimerase
MGRTIVIGACGQIGTELVLELRKRRGLDLVIAADVKDMPPKILASGFYVKLDVLDRNAVRECIVKNGITEVYLLAALLSATAEQHPDFAWRLNMEGLFTVLELAKEGIVKKIFWPSSIAVFGPSTPKVKTPQVTVTEPITIYGISKLAGERWCEYYHQKYGVDIRSIRYPGLISYTSLPGGGTTDYAVDIFYQAKLKNHYTSFLSHDSELPMMYMEDAIRATIELMEADPENVTIRSSYNLSGCSFTPEQLAAEIRKFQSDFTIEYKPDFRQGIANGWPKSIDDSAASKDWGWSAHFGLSEIVAVMLQNVNTNLLGSSSAAD